MGFISCVLERVEDRRCNTSVATARVSFSLLLVVLHYPYKYKNPYMNKAAKEPKISFTRETIIRIF